MNVPLVVVSDVYDILCEFDETPIVSKETFFSLCSKGLIFNYSFDCNNCLFFCEKPFNCSVVILEGGQMSEDKLQELNNKLNHISNKCQKTLAFW